MVIYKKHAMKNKVYIMIIEEKWLIFYLTCFVICSFHKKYCLRDHFRLQKNETFSNETLMVSMHVLSLNPFGKLIIL